MSLFNELKRRNVFRVSIAYIIAAWLVMQFADVILNNVAAPDWVFQVILLLLGIGLLFAIFFAWAFELTPEGLKKEKDVDRGQSITRHTGRKLDYIIIGVLVVALGYFVMDKFFWQPVAPTGTAVSGEQSPGQTVTHSIAVLPFVNMSGDASNEYFSDGISEEILNVLAKIRELKVAGRTSSFAFKGKNEDLRTIGEKLNVKTLLEGSVRKDDKRQKVRVTVQLINVADGYHIWSESYDRSLEDIFAIQEEIALEVATALKIELLGEEVEKITGIARSNLSAYDLYLQGRSSLAEFSFTSLPRALEEFEQSIVLDPDYLPAQLGLAETYLQMERTGAMAREDSLSHSRPILETVLERDPQNGLALVLMARVMRIQKTPNFQKAEDNLRLALAHNPRNVAAISQLASVLSRTNRGAESLVYYQQAESLEPYSALIQTSLCTMYAFRLEFEKALEAGRKLREIDPIHPYGFACDALVYKNAGQLDQAIYSFVRASAIDPRDPELPALIARLWLDLDDLQQAELWLAKAEVIDPGHPATIGAGIVMLHAKEMVSEAKQLARQAQEAQLSDRTYFRETIGRALVSDAVEKGQIDKALQLLQEIWPEDFESLGRGGEPFSEIRYPIIIKILLMQDPASAQAFELMASIEQSVADADKSTSPIYWRVVTAMLEVVRGNEDAAVASLQAAFESGGLRVNWRDRYVDNYIWASLESHPGFQQIITMLEDEAVTQRENAYKLLASLH